MAIVKRILGRGLAIDDLERPERAVIVRVGLFVAAAAVGLRLFFWWYTGRLWEDALITVLHSENFVSGLGLTHYRTGEPPLHGFTSPLSVLVPLMGDLFKVGFGLSFIRLVSAFAGGLTVIYALGIGIHPKVRLPGPLIFLAMGYLAFEHHQILWGMAGMETQIATCILLMSFYYLIAEKPAALGASLGLCMLARPDFAFWCAIAGFYVLLTRPKRLAVVVPIAVAIYLPWIVFTTLYYGSPIPNTIIAKGLGYPLWTRAPGLGWADIARNILLAVTGSYIGGTLFQPLGLSFAGHGIHFRQLVADHGIVCDGMVGFAGVGAIALLIKRQWALVPALLFLVVYGAYYTFFVAFVFSWYVIPFVAMAVFLSARGIEAVGGVVRPARVRQVAFSVLAVAYVGMFVVFLPRTFTAEKRIQEEIENPVRKQIGLFLGRVMGKDQSVGCEPLGYVAYYSRRTVYDWPGLADRRVVEYSRTHPNERALMPMLRCFQPDFLALRYGEYENSFEETWIDANYEIIASFEVDFAKTRDILNVTQNGDREFFVLAKRGYAGEKPGVDPRHAHAWSSIGFRLAKQARRDEAIACFERALAIDPAYSEAHDNWGMTLAEAGDVRGAAEHLAAALRLDPNNARAHNNSAVVLLRQGAVDEAIAQFRDATRLDPKYTQAYINLGNLLGSRGDYAGAMAQFRAALKIEPYDKDALAGVKRVEEARGN